MDSSAVGAVSKSTTPPGGSVISSPAVTSAAVSAQVGDQRVRDGLAAADRDGPADGMCERGQHQSGTGGDERRHPRDGMCGNAGEQRAGIFAGELAPQRGALLEHVAGDERRGDRIARNRTLVAEEKVRRHRRQSVAAGPTVGATNRRGAAPRTCGRGRGIRPPSACPEAGWRRRRPAPSASHRGLADRTRRRTAMPVPADAQPSRCRGKHRRTRGRPGCARRLPTSAGPRRPAPTGRRGHR